MKNQNTKHYHYWTTIDGKFKSWDEIKQHYNIPSSYAGYKMLSKKYNYLKIIKHVIKGTEPLLEYKWHPKFTDYCIDIEGNVYRYNEENGYRYIKPYINQNEKLGVNKSNDYGYATIQPYIGKKRYITYHHRMVAEAWIPNPKKLRCVNHINEIKYDNRVENLEWTTYKKNAKHSHHRLFGPKETKHVWVLKYKGKVIGEANKQKELSTKLGIPKNVIVYLRAIETKLDQPLKSKYQDYELIKKSK